MNVAKSTKRTLVYRCALLLIGVVNVMPRSLAVFLGAILGQAAHAILIKDRLKARRNLKLAYGDRLTDAQRKTIVRNLFANFGRNAVDILRTKKHYDSEIKNLIDVEGLEHIERVYNRGKGVLGITGHIGNFELLAAWFVKSKYKVAVIGREMYDSRLNHLLVDYRESLGMINIDTKDSVRKIVQVLKDGYILGVLIDTDSFRVRSVFVPAFGRLSHTPVGQSVLGLKTGAGFVPVACVRNGSRYKIVVKPEITIERTGDIDRDAYEMTKKCTHALEEIITDYKDQWIWIHNRWHNRPEVSIP
ncbi:MAG: lysophospholipid acyltransferase family protein [candidate division Zixibacteria bacterium]|nr:lysophospholipid acyltransferase family protein [candidate division Zixibacteria bacterium]